MNFAELDWDALDRLRIRFLQGGSDGPYWRSESELACYDTTFGERIGWKWDQVIRELRLRGCEPSGGSLLDWGCGSGIAARRILAAFGADRFDELLVWDHSPLAVEFASRTASASFPGLRIAHATPGFLESREPLGTLIVSHVINELNESARRALRALCLRARTVIWVDAGTHEASRLLGREREELAGSFRIVAPCTHSNACPAFLPENASHWCHFFAPPPAGILADSNWVRFGKRAGVDLRSAPYSFFALERKVSSAGDVTRTDLSRIIGRPESLKPSVRFLACDSSGLSETSISRRHSPALCRELERTREPLVYRWIRRDGEITGGKRLGVD